jgi:hypothetical protein
MEDEYMGFMSVADLNEKDEYYRLYEEAIDDGYDDDEARMIARDTLDFRRNPNRYYGVSLDD